MDWFPGWSFYAVPWMAAIITGSVLSATGRRWWQAAGIALMTVPLWDTAWGILSSIEPLVQGGQVLRAYTKYELSYVFSYKFLSDLGYLGVGFLLYGSGGTWHGMFQAPRTVAKRLIDVGFPTGRRTEGHSAFLGAVALPLLLVGSIAISYWTRGAESLRQSDEENVFANMTLYHAILLSAAAAVGEELVYRGFFQTILARRMPMVVAIILQAVFFGFAHSGYGTWIHVLLPALFGIVVGFAAWRFGIWMAIVMHFLVDVYAFGSEASSNQAWLIPILNTLFFANIILTLAWGVWWLKGKIWSRTRPQAA